MENEEIDRERIDCLVQQGFTPLLAKNVLLARTRAHLPLTIWIVDNSTSMDASDGRRLVSTESQDCVRLEPCTRWEELNETLAYHARLAALLEAPTKFVLLNGPNYGDEQTFLQETSIAERGSEWIEDDLEFVLDNFSKVSPCGTTPLTDHLRRIYQSLQHMDTKIVLVLATDGRPTDPMGFTSPLVDLEFEQALKQVQSKAWIVVRLCTNEDSVLEYYQKLDDQMELSLEVLDDFLDEAKEVHEYNPWLTYSLALHRCREMGMSCHSIFRFLDWLDERALSPEEIGTVVTSILGLVDDRNGLPSTSENKSEWMDFCRVIQHEQEAVLQQRTRKGTKSAELDAFFPWNTIQKQRTHWVDLKKLKQHGKKQSLRPNACIWIVIIVPIAIYIHQEISAFDWNFTDLCFSWTHGRYKLSR